MKTYFIKSYFPLNFLIIFLFFWFVLAINPTYRDVWFFENILLIVSLFILIFSFNKFRFSNLSYFLIFLIGVFQTIGAHYSYSEVPINFINIFNFERNHYDRLIHFLFGLLLAYPFYELLTRKNIFKKNSFWAYFFIISCAFATGAIYEILEWGYAIYFEEESATGVLGSQGDIWDAQKDILLEGIGAFITIFIIHIFKK